MIVILNWRTSARIPFLDPPDAALLPGSHSVSRVKQDFKARAGKEEGEGEGMS